MQRFALPAAALALLAGTALASTTITLPAEPAPAPAPVAEHSLVSGGGAVDGELPTLPLDD